MTASQYRRDMSADGEMSIPLPHGQLSDGWRTVAFITWIFTAAATIAIAITSRTIGRPVWWLGSESDPATPFLMLVPVAVVVVPLVASVRQGNRTAVISVICSVLLMASALVDFGSTPAIALALAVVGCAAFATSIALWAVSRQYR